MKNLLDFVLILRNVIDFEIPHNKIAWIWCSYIAFNWLIHNKQSTYATFTPFEISFKKSSLLCESERTSLIHHKAVLMNLKQTNVKIFPKQLLFCHKSFAVSQQMKMEYKFLQMWLFLNENVEKCDFWFSDLAKVLKCKIIEKMANNILCKTRQNYKFNLNKYVFIKFNFALL